jgi:hypothetical protein
MLSQQGVRTILLRFAPLTLLLCVVTSSAALAQAPEASAASHSAAAAPQRAPLHHLYWHLLLYQNYLDRRAALREQQGRSKDAEILRTHFQKALHFTDSQFAIVREAGLQLEKDLNAVQAKVLPIVYEDRQWIKLHGRLAGPPPGHAQVHELRQEHEAVILNAVAKLNKDLSPTAATQLQTYVETEWASHVTVHKFHPRPHDPKDLKHMPKAPSQLEPRQNPEAQQ